MNRLRYAFILWMERVLVRWQYALDVAHVEDRYRALIMKDISQEEYINADLEFYNTWGTTWRKI